MAVRPELEEALLGLEEARDRQFLMFLVLADGKARTVRVVETRFRRLVEKCTFEIETQGEISPDEMLIDIKSFPFK